MVHPEGTVSYIDDGIALHMLQPTDGKRGIVSATSCAPSTLADSFPCLSPFSQPRVFLLSLSLPLSPRFLSLLAGITMHAYSRPITCCNIYDAATGCMTARKSGFFTIKKKLQPMDQQCVPCTAASPTTATAPQQS